MKKTALLVLAAACASALLLIAAGLKSYGLEQPYPYAAASWLSAILAFGVFAVMLAQYFLHGRRVHLYLGAAFLSLGIMGLWDTLTFRYYQAFVEGAYQQKWAYFAIWQSGWLTLAMALVAGLAAGRKSVPRQRPDFTATALTVAAGLLWASVIIFLMSAIPAVPRLLSLEKAGPTTTVVCAVIFAAGALAYSRHSVHKNNAVLSWLAYGLIFGVFAQIAMALQEQPTESLFGFAGVMKVLVFAAPLAGMLAEHGSLQVRLHDQAGQLSSLIEAQQAVSLMGSPGELYQRIVDLVAFSFSADGVCLMPFDKERGLLYTAARTGFDEESAKRLIFRPGEGPPGDSFSDKEIQFVRDVFDDPVLAPKLEGVEGIASAAFAPLIARGACLGVLAVFFGGRPMQKLGKEQVRLLDALANQAAVAVDAVQMRERVVDSARASEDYAREMEIVWEIGQAVTSTLDLHALVDTLAEKMRGLMGAATCSVLVFEPDVSGLKIMGHRRLTRYHNVADHVDQCDLVAAEVARTGRTMVMNDVPNSALCKYPEMARDDTGAHHLLCVPMSLPGFLGAVSVFRQNAPSFGEREKRLLGRLAPIVAIGIRNAELYQRERRIAENLQQSFLPALETELPGIQIACLYQAAYDESQVGGDFYDLTDFGDGLYGITIGDVAGKGLDAAVYTAMSRYMIQAYSAADRDPSQVISQLNGALCRYTPPTKFVTLVYGVLDTNENTFTYVNAGHELPFLYRKATGEIESLQTTGPAVGALIEAEYAVESTAFEPGDMLIFYTDGATEVRSEGKFLGTEGLQEIVSEQIRKNAEDLPAAILEAVRNYASGHLRDDVAILVIKARTPGELF